jgi:hypothetical protein
MGLLYKRLFDKGLAYSVNSWVREITDTAVTVYDLYTGRERRIEEVALVALATTARPDDALFEELLSESASVIRIGDCLAPRKIDQAIYKGFVAGAERFDDRFIQEGELEAWHDEEPSVA